jgi:hypothetical protein
MDPTLDAAAVKKPPPRRAASAAARRPSPPPSLSGDSDAEDAHESDSDGGRRRSRGGRGRRGRGRGRGRAGRAPGRDPAAGCPFKDYAPPGGGWGEDPAAASIAPATALPRAPELAAAALPADAVGDAVASFLVLRAFSWQLRLSPFSLADWCAALADPNPTHLLDEAAVCVLRTLAADDTAAARRTRSLPLDLLDAVTWPEFAGEALRRGGLARVAADLLADGDGSAAAAAAADASPRPASAAAPHPLRALLSASATAPLGRTRLGAGVPRHAPARELYARPPRVKAAAVAAMVDLLLDTRAVRAEIDRREEAGWFVAGDGGAGGAAPRKARAVATPPPPPQAGADGDAPAAPATAAPVDDGNDDACALCGVGGNLLCCERCPASYHVRCVGVSGRSLPEGEWDCPECEAGGRHESAGLRVPCAGADGETGAAVWLAHGVALRGARAPRKGTGVDAVEGSSAGLPVDAAAGEGAVAVAARADRAAGGERPHPATLASALAPIRMADAATTNSAEAFLNRYRNAWNAATAAYKALYDEGVRRRGRPTPGLPRGVTLSELPCPLPLSRYVWPQSQGKGMVAAAVNKCGRCLHCTRPNMRKACLAPVPVGGAAAAAVAAQTGKLACVVNAALRLERELAPLLGGPWAGSSGPDWRRAWTARVRDASSASAIAGALADVESALRRVGRAPRWRPPPPNPRAPPAEPPRIARTPAGWMLDARGGRRDLAPGRLPVAALRAAARRGAAARVRGLDYALSPPVTPARLAWLRDVQAARTAAQLAVQVRVLTSGVLGDALRRPADADAGGWAAATLLQRRLAPPDGGAPGEVYEYLCDMGWGPPAAEEGEGGGDDGGAGEPAGDAPPSFSAPATAPTPPPPSAPSYTEASAPQEADAGAPDGSTALAWHVSVALHPVEGATPSVVVEFAVRPPGTGAPFLMATIPPAALRAGRGRGRARSDSAGPKRVVKRWLNLAPASRTLRQRTLDKETGRDKDEGRRSGSGTPEPTAGVPLALEPGALPPVPTSSPVWLHEDAVPLWLIREFEDTKRRVGSAGARGPRAPTARGASGRAGVCPTCDDRVEADDAAIECAGACGASFHVACAGVPPDADAAALADWECAECASSAHPGGAGRRETERQRALREEAAKARREGRAPPTGDGRRPSSAGGATGKRKRALVCVCRTPEEVDDPRGFVGCDGCGRWFHPPCVGTTLAAVDAAPTWHCPACTGDGAKIEGGIAARRAREVLAAVGATRVGAPFAEPVLEEEVPGYHAVVKHPMDLGTIMTRLDRGVGGPGAHYPSLAAVAADVDLVWRNCRAFNRPSSTIAKAADEAAAALAKKWGQAGLPPQLLKATGGGGARAGPASPRPPPAPKRAPPTPLPAGAPTPKRPAWALSAAPGELALAASALERVMATKAGSWFAVAVTDAIAPGYSAVIRHPMDLGTVAARCRAGLYPDLGQVLDDVDRVWANCRLYNPAGEPVLVDAMTAEAAVGREWARAGLPARGALAAAGVAAGVGVGFGPPPPPPPPPPQAPLPAPPAAGGYGGFGV